MTLNELYTLETLPEHIQNILLVQKVLDNKTEYRTSRDTQRKISNEPMDLFGNNSNSLGIETNVKPSFIETTVKWATTNYDPPYNFNEPITHDAFHLIIPRSEKSKEIQKKRTKEKAEVFTPTWVCNIQNNLIDDTIKPNLFNKVSSDQKTWVPTDKVVFPGNYKWEKYVLLDRIEITCGEAPYLFSPYDTVTGETLPVRDNDGRFQRIGLFDRKLRVISENTPNNDKQLWIEWALTAMRTIFGYEWQGDNLLLARLNFINTVNDYYYDKFNENISEDILRKTAEIASWNLWQMDGLKMVLPDSCTNVCPKCSDKTSNQHHDGILPVIRFNRNVKNTDYQVIPFEDLTIK